MLRSSNGLRHSRGFIVVAVLWILAALSALVLIYLTFVTNTAVIVVRYFGGTLLGVPGLINAYKSAAALALQLVPIVTKPVEVFYELHFDYTLVNEVMMVVRQYQCRVKEQELQLFCRMVLGIPKNRLEETLYKLGQIYGVEVKAHAPAAR